MNDQIKAVSATQPPQLDSREEHDSAQLIEERVSALDGDRLCTNCHYNLIGQPVLREPYYQMFIVRCPECATVAALQEFPPLGRWSHRWASYRWHWPPAPVLRSNDLWRRWLSEASCRLHYSPWRSSPDSTEITSVRLLTRGVWAHS